MLAIAGAPYANGPAWSFHFTELSIYALMIGCLIHAWKRRNGALAYLLGGTLFGVMLEYSEVIGGSYTYGRFCAMLGHAPLDVPLWVGLAWGVIMYTARLFSDTAGLPLLGAAALDALLALNIDSGIDAVAYRMHFWNWDWNGTGRDPLTVQWFGIPYGNFVGWITVVFCYSVFSRLFERRILSKQRTATRRACVAALAAICSYAALFASEMLLFPILNSIGFKSGPRLLLLTVLLLVFSARAWRQRRPSGEATHPLAQWVPGWFHVFFLCCFFALGFYRENQWMTIATVVNFLIGIAVHCFLMRPQSSRQAAMASTPFEIAPDGIDVLPAWIGDSN